MFILDVLGTRGREYDILLANWPQVLEIVMPVGKKTFVAHATMPVR